MTVGQLLAQDGVPTHFSHGRFSYCAHSRWIPSPYGLSGDGILNRVQ